MGVAACTSTSPLTPDTGETAGDATGEPSVDASSWACPPEGLEPVTTPIVDDDRVREASGLVVDADGEHLWVHNDSGDAARLLAVRRSDGAVTAEVSFTDTLAIDWEEMAWDRRDGHDRWVVGDIGDNARARGAVLLQIADVVPADADADVTPRTVTLTYGDDTAHDAEAMLVDPATGEVVVVTKDFGLEVGVFAAALPDGGEAVGTLDLVGTWTFGTEALPDLTGLVTAADVAPGGRAVAVRTYTTLFLWDNAEGRRIADLLLDPPSCRLALASQAQGETIAFVDATTLVTLSEGAKQPLHTYSWTVPTSP